MGNFGSVFNMSISTDKTSVSLLKVLWVLTQTFENSPFQDTLLKTQGKMLSAHFSL